MEPSYLNIWLKDFPKLKILLSKEDKEVLDKINPKKYVDFNLTKESEVIRIIDDHKPQAWKWIQMYPNLRDLPPEDYAVLDRIVPSDYISEVTEEDVRRIIAYRKENARKKKSQEAEDKARRYYEEHAKDIAQEEKDRTFLSKIPHYSLLFGISFITAGIVVSDTAIPSLPYFLIGVPSIVIPWVLCSLVLKKLDKSSVTPKSVHTKDDRIDFISAVFILCFYIGLVGVGIFLGSMIIWQVLSWTQAEGVFFTGLLTLVGSAFLFLLIAIVTPSKK